MKGISKMQNYLLYTLAGLIVSALGVYAFVRMNKNATAKSKARQGGKPVPEPTPIQAPAKPEKPSWPFENNIDLFKNEVSKLWQLSTGLSQSISEARLNFNNITSSIRFHGNDEQKKWWAEFTQDRDNWDISNYVAKSEFLLKELQSRGISFDTDQEIEWDERADFLYNSIDKVENGDKCQILTPAVLYNGRPFEMGIVKLI